MSQQNILVIDDEPDIRNLVQEILVDEGYQVRVAEDTNSARKHANKLQPDLVLLDIWMPGEDGISLLKDWQDNGSVKCPVVMMSGHGTVETAVEATRLGAYDFIEKPLTMAKLLVSVKRALENVQEEETLAEEHRITEEPIGSSMQIRAIRDHAKKLAQHQNVLLIMGESGAGKRIFAHYVHSLSPKKSNIFVTISEDTFNKKDAAQELFGLEADGVIKKGILETCKDGTVYIDDVANINSQGQKLLSKLLQRKQFTRVGGTASLSLDARLMFSTSQNLNERVKANKFNDELYFRINVIPVRIPALREHSQDVPELLRYYVDYYCSQENYPYRNISIAAQNQLLHYKWPGNIRELKNLVQRLLILSSSDEVSADEVGVVLEESGDEANKNQISDDWHEKLYNLPLREARESFERGYLLYQLKQVNGNISKLAERVGMERTHLYRKLRALGISAKEN